MCEFLVRKEHACNQEIKVTSGNNAEFVYQCCHMEAEGMVCSTDDDGVWITILYMCITLVKVRTYKNL